LDQSLKKLIKQDDKEKQATKPRVVNLEPIKFNFPKENNINFTELKERM